MLSQTELTRITSSCQTSKESWNSYFYEAMCYTQPERNYIWRFKGGFAGDNKQVPLFTQAGKNGTNIFVARVQNKLTPYEKPYINFSPKKSIESSYVHELRDFCAVISDKCNELKNELKLDNELNDSYYDLCIGTSMIMREDTIHGRRFKKIPFTDYKLGTEQHQTVCRDFKIAAYQIGITFPELMHRRIIGGIDTKGTQKYDEVTLNDILYFNERTLIWEYYLRWNTEILVTRQYKSSPYHIFHWTRATDMPYGTGVALQAIPVMKRLNSYIKVKLELIPFAFPMFFTQSGNFSDRNIQFKPGGVINVRDINATKPVPLSTEKQTFMLEIQTEELQIKQTFLDYTLPTDPRQMTAAEVYARSNPQDEMVMMNVSRLTGTIKALAWDIFEDIFNRELANTVSFKFHQIKALLECNINNDATIDTTLIEKMNGYIQSIGQFDPQAIWQGLNRGKTIQRYGEAFNLPIEMRHTAEEIDELQEEVAQSQVDAMQAQMQAQMAVDTNKEAAIADREQVKE